MIKKLLRVIPSVILIVSIALTVYVIHCRSNGQNVAVFGVSAMRVVTDSMTPTISAGDVIFVRETAAESLNIGDIIAFYSDAPDIRGMVNTHRIVGRNADGSFVTKGDSAPDADRATVSENRLIGRYIAKISLPEEVSARNICAVLVILIAAALLRDIADLLQNRKGHDL